MISNHQIEYGNQFSHTGGEDDFMGLARVFAGGPDPWGKSHQGSDFLAVEPAQFRPITVQDILDERLACKLA